MSRHDRDPPDLSGIPVPPHRPGFWDDVESGLAAVDAERSVGGDQVAPVVELTAPRDGNRRFPPWLAASAAAAAVVLVVGGAAALMTRGPQDSVAGPAATGLGGEASASTATTAALIAEAVSPPWGAPALSREAAPYELLQAWELAENQQWCSALAPETLPAPGRGAVVRRAEFAGGWALAWDRPSGPGQSADGSDCADCGRSAFGIAGTGVTYGPDTGRSRTASTTWADGSFVTIAPEGGDESRSKLLAEIVVAGQGCLYQAWSNLGEEHLREFVDALRLVDGLTAPPVELRSVSDPPQVTQRNEPPWSAAGDDVVALDALVEAQWVELGVARPQLFPADLGDAVESATMRTWGLGVAWDNAAGPGHDGQNQPCTQCGRGVVGVGWQTATDDAGGIQPANRIEWADGSYATYGGRLADPALPRDRVLFFDAETGEATVDALQAVVHVAGLDHDVVIWTHLGEEHLLYLIDQLRWVGSAG